jgi:hypothetical protein
MSLVACGALLLRDERRIVVAPLGACSRPPDGLLDLDGIGSD